eukprot:TRINITY_DN3790_c0_g1_i1.p1 TRINITY_DN3790_c0_g1~~TRINITY_DN3790_c0_g1_i1.p1  ORF type:complete len:132 (+),score=42.80 TRINITY_DN3790_c0_g1_i1:54-398(+)
MGGKFWRVLRPHRLRRLTTREWTERWEKNISLIRFYNVMPGRLNKLPKRFPWETYELEEIEEKFDWQRRWKGNPDFLVERLQKQAQEREFKKKSVAHERTGAQNDVSLIQSRRE